MHLYIILKQGRNAPGQPKGAPQNFEAICQSSLGLAKFKAHCGQSNPMPTEAHPKG